MSAFKQRMAKTGARALLLATVVVAALAVSGIGASSASAACTEATTAIKGQGSSLQKTAQTEWSGTFNGAGDCVTYTSTGSGTGMSQWGYETGSFPAEGGTNWAYIGTDDAPTSGQITKMREAGGGTANQHLQVIPVAQAAIAIIVNPPANCTVTKITQADLEKVWQGTITNWSGLANKTEDVAGACESHIKRIVRKDASGTTFQFKRFLAKINTKTLDCVGKTWKQLAEPANNTVWPESCEATSLNTIEVAPATGGGSLAETVKNNAGTIGYVDTATAKGKSNQILEVQNGEKSFSLPYLEEAGKHKANCAKATYTVPAEGRETGTGENVEWTEVTGSALETTTYPICTLTWDLAWGDYSNAGYGAGIWTTVEHWFTYVLGAEGQEKLEQNWYAPLPSGGAASVNVLTAANYALEKTAE